MTSQKKQVNIKNEYDFIKHAEFISQIIGRMSKFHLQWIFVLFTITGFGITMDKFLIDLSSIVRIVLMIILTITIFALLVFSLLVSTKYFKIENAYRDKQARIFNKEFHRFDMKPDITNKTRSSSWIINMGWLIISIYSTSQITLLILIAMNII